MLERRWLLVCFLSAIAAMLVFSAVVWLPVGWATVLLGVGVVAFLAVLWHHPEYWHRRTVSAVLGIWLTSCAMAGLSFTLQFAEGCFGYFVVGHVDWSFHIAVAVIVCFLLVLDYFKNANVILNIAQRIREETSAVDEVGLISLAPSNARAKLITQLIQAKARFFPVDVDNLSREQRHDIVVRQIDVAAKELLSSSKLRTTLAVVLTVLAVTVGALAILYSRHEALVRTVRDLEAELSGSVPLADAAYWAAHPVPVSERAKALAKLIGPNAPPYALALKAIAEERYADARKHLADDRQRIQRETHLNHRATGQTHFYEGQFSDAITWFESALALAPDDSACRQQIAICLLRNDRVNDALTHLEILETRFSEMTKQDIEEDLNTYLITALNNKGYALRLAGTPLEAVSEHRRAIQRCEAFASLLEDSRKFRDARTTNLHNLATALMDAQEFQDAIKTYTQVIDEFEISFSENTTITAAVRLATSFTNRCIAYDKSGNHQKAINDFEEVVRNQRDWTERFDDELLLENLAYTLSEFGAVLSRFDRHEEAVKRYNEALRIQDRLITEHEMPLLFRKAATLSNRGMAKESQEKWGGALSDYDEAIRIYSKLLAGQREVHLARSLSKTFHARGSLHSKKGRMQQALADLDAAIKLRRTLVKDKGQLQFGDGLASSLWARGQVCSKLNQLEDAIGDCDTAISVLSTLVFEHSREDLGYRLQSVQGTRATVLATRGVNRLAAGKFAAAKADLDVAVSVFRQLSEARKDEAQWKVNLTLALEQQGLAARKSGDTNQYVKSLDETIVILRSLFEQSDGLAEYGKQLATDLNDLANALAKTQEFERAYLLYTEAIGLYKQLSEETPSLRFEMANTYSNRGNILANLSKPSEAIDDFDIAVQIYRDFGDDEGVAKGLSNRALAHMSAQSIDDALVDLREAKRIYEMLRSKKDSSVLTERYVVCLINLGLVHKMSGNVAPANEVLLNAQSLTKDSGMLEHIERLRSPIAR